jgi:hypothetical protein
MASYLNKKQREKAILKFLSYTLVCILLLLYQYLMSSSMWYELPK